MSISGIGSSSAFDPAAFASSAANKVVKTLDANGDQSLDKTEFVNGLTANGVSADDAAKLFDKLDTEKTGKVTQSAIEENIKTNLANQKAPSGPPPSGPPPDGAQSSSTASGTSGASSSSGSGSSGSATSTSTDTKNYDKKDLDKDGTVTTEEELIYSLKHPSEVKTETTSSAKNVGSNVDVSV